ncbi:TonB-dependent receptor [Derxia gummosa]|uniref:TonB-dependent receptor n=1 Tax=Derxia gummosa DSM 723 TaxID=1121388 RepID=A0A8B6X6C9_9BURK|nr:TonB-dependent receptor [Derxia gummosa]
MPTCPARLAPLALTLAAVVPTGAGAESATTAPGGPGASTTLERREFRIHYDNGVGTSNAASEGAVTGALIESRPLLRTGELLEFVPGVVVTQHSGDGKANQYFLRGFNLDHGTDFATWVDGMPVNSPTHAHGQGYTDLGFVIPELVRRIDYRKGPYAADDGDFASAGSARLALRDTLPARLAQITAGSYGYRRALLAGSTDLDAEGAAGSLLAALDHSRADGPWRVPENLARTSALLRWSRHLGGADTSLTAMHSQAGWTATDQIPARAVAAGLDRYASLDPSDGGRSARASLSFNHRQALDDGDWSASLYAVRSKLNLYSNFTYWLDSPADGDQFEQAERRTTVGGSLARSVDGTLLGLPATHRLGVQARFDRLAPVGLYTTVARTRTGTTQESEVKQSLVGIFGETTLRLAPWLRAIGGLRVDRADADVTSSLAANSGGSAATLASPKLSFVAGPWAATEVFLNAGTGFHGNDARGTVARVSPREGTAAGAVPALVRSKGAELGLRTEAIDELRLSAALWRLDLASELVFVGDAGDTEPTHASTRHGVELSANWRPLPGLIVDADLALSRARYVGEGVAAGADRIPGAIGKAGSLGIGGENGPFSGQLQWRWFGPRPLVEDGSQRSASTVLAQARLGWRARPDLRLTLDVFNLFDRRASDIDYFYESRLPGETAAVADRHFHPVEPRSARLTLAWMF